MMKISMNKKILFSIGAALFAVAVFAVAPVSAEASVSWNQSLQHLGSGVKHNCPAAYVRNSTTSQNSTQYCWGTSVQASPGDTVQVALYYHNTGTSVSHNTTLFGTIPSGYASSHTVTGRVTGGGASDSDSVNINIVGGNAKLEYVSALWYPNNNGSGGQSVSGSPAGGFNIGSIDPYTVCQPNSQNIIDPFCKSGDVLVTLRVVAQVTPPPATCSITSFSANPTTVQQGNSSTLSWNTSNCTNVSVSGGNVSSNSANGSASTGSLQNTTTYTINASNATSSDSRSLIVNVNQNPPQTVCQITSFSGTPLQVQYGSSATVSWNTSNCTSVSVSGPGVSSSSHNGSTSTGALYNTSTYTITASNATSTDSRTVTISVGQQQNQCTINTFLASPSQVTQGQSATLTWSTTGCTYAYISGVNTIGNQLNGSISTGPVYGTRTYTLTATGTNTDTRTVTVSTYQVPNNTYACQDGYDNDGDGYVDYPNDPGCSSRYDNDEYDNYNNNVPPTVTTNAATNVTETDATLNGYFSTGGNNGCSGAYCANGTYFFQYGTNANSLTQQTASRTMNNSYGSNVQAYVSGLQKNTTYYFRLVGSNSQGTRYGTTLSFVTPGVQTQNLNVVTTLATNISSSSARLNGLVTGANVGSVSSYFEYGTSPSLGFTTNRQNVSTTTLQNYFDTIATSQNTTYYYRAVAESGGVTYRGSTVSFTTPGVTTTNTNTNTNTTTTTTVNTNTTNTTRLVSFGTGAGSPLVMLAINDGFQGVAVNGFQSGFQTLGFTNQYQNVIPGEIITYSIHYKNISDATLSNAILNVVLPHDVTFRQSTQGVLTTDNTVAAAIGTLTPGQEGVIVTQGIVNTTANPGTNLVATATLAFTTPSLGQDSAIAYALNTVGIRGNSLAGLALFGGGFFPTTLLGWIILLGIILIIILIARYFYYERRSQTVNIHNSPNTY